MAVHNPVTLCGVDSSGNAEAIGVTNGAAAVADATPDYMPYTDGTYNFHCETYTREAALSDPVWTVTRETIATGRFQVAPGLNAATDLATIQALFA